jgi:opacity protein-like surface antigen
MYLTIKRSALLVLLALPYSTSVQASESIRDGAWEATIQLVGTGSESSKGENGSSVDFDSAVGWGIGITYNFNRRLALGFDGAYVRPKYDAVIVSENEGPVTLSHKASVFTGALNGTWNLLESHFTPYLQLGVGWTHLDSNVADSPPVTGCWWDPLWGYICSNFYSTYKDTRFSWNAGLGLRYEFPNDMFVKASANRVFIDGDNNAADPDLDVWKLELGWMLR